MHEARSKASSVVGDVHLSVALMYEGDANESRAKQCIPDILVGFVTGTLLKVQVVGAALFAGFPIGLDVKPSKC